MKRNETLCALAALLLIALPPAQAGELYAQAIGQPPERPPAPAQPPAEAPPAPTEPKTTEEEAGDEAKVAEAARREQLRTRILIGAGLALALGALAGGGGNGTVPNH